jgi:hypothetical protein
MIQYFEEPDKTSRYCPYHITDKPETWITTESVQYELLSYIRFEVFTAMTMKNAVFWYIKPQSVLHVSATEPSRLMLCKIWGFHGTDYEECRLLRYKNPVHTWQETHYFSATESTQLCKIWGYHGDDYEEWDVMLCSSCKNRRFGRT